MRFLVTGGAGLIGSNTVDELVRRGHDVVVLDDFSAGKAGNLAQVRPKIQLMEASVTNFDALREACRGVDCVIHLAAQTSVPRSVKDPIETNLVNVSGTLNVLVAARDAKARADRAAGHTAIQCAPGRPNPGNPPKVTIGAPYKAPKDTYTYLLNLSSPYFNWNVQSDGGGPVQFWTRAPLIPAGGWPVAGL